MRRSTAASVACVAAVLAVAGCGRPATRPPDPTREIAAQPPPVAPVEEPEATEPASVVTTSVPRGLPAGFPLPKGDVAMAETVDAEEGVSFTVAVDLPGAPADAARAYAAALAAAGYSVEPVVTDAAGATVVFSRGGEAEQGAATFEATAAGTRASVTLTVVE